MSESGGLLLVTMTVICLLLQGPSENVERVRQGYLEFSAMASIGLVFEAYDWFEEFQWTAETTDGAGALVTFNGTIDDGKAVEAFESENKYRFGFALKAMQLAPTYGLTKRKEWLRFVIRFKITPKGSFEVHSGALGIRDKNQASWRFEPLTDKALVSLIRGIYRNQDPYTCLVKGLPFK